MELTAAYETYRRLLFSIAYRLLGRVAEAEDVVQDVFVSLQAADREKIDDMKAFLSRAVTNRCLNILKSARSKREVYPGPWLPEPLYAVSEGDEPSRRLELGDEIRYAYLVMLDRLSPLERVVYVLREAYAFEYEEIAGMIGKTPDNCRKMLSRARAKLGPDAVAAAPDEKRRTAAEQFIEALRRGDIPGAVGLLSDQVVIVTDGGGKVRAAMQPIAGIARVDAFLAGIAAKRVFALGVAPASVNGETGMLVKREGLPAAVWTFELDPASGRIARIYAVYNPDKLHGE
ncbi:RNA polymerase sigma-70 factor [Paenibacillus sp. GYB003]|uniref:RNA polymerase sigma-70 factor n=1 Tax=Paenibacillus sp. GYB003 TaxID=2994392 RepID=UPI002F9621E1